MNNTSTDSKPALGAESDGTYASLAKFGTGLLSSQGRSPGQIANYVTALRSWCRHTGRSDSASLGDDFGRKFDALFLHFQDHEAESVSRRTLKDRCEQLLWWHKVAEQHKGQDVLPLRFGDAFAVAFKASGLTKAALCREARISAPTLDNWLGSKRLPVRASAHMVAAVEAALELSPGTLAKRLPPRRSPRYARDASSRDERPMTAYGRRLQRNRAKTGSYRPDLTARFRTQWEQLIELKTDTERFGGTIRHWSTRPARKCGMRLKWYMMTEDGAVCPTASVHYGIVMSYLGFLKLPPEKGGLGIQQPVDTLAWLVRSDCAIQYLKWVRRRADGLLHNGLFTTIQYLMSHIRPETGFLWLNPWLSTTLPDAAAGAADTDEKWRERCAAAHNALAAYARRLKREGKPQRSRDPREVIGDIVGTDFPMKELIRIIRALESDPPPSSQKRNYATWIRDVLLLRMLCRHPLRAGHFSVMTFRGPDSNLMRTSDGWRLHFDVLDFKNRGSEAAGPYTVAFDVALAEWLDRYLTEARPLMLNADDSDYLFLPSRVGNLRGGGTEPLATGAWTADGMYKRVKELTAMYTGSGIGLHPHAFRHIPATDHLIRFPEDYMTVAKMLNDKLETVLREYNHTEIRNGIRTLQRTIEQAEAELSAAEQ
jgi:integrase/transcriptional regulator with XRE-family HTH domain